MLLKKYKSLAEPVKASLWFVISNVLTRGVSFITLPIFSRLLTTSEYGQVSVYQSWVSIVSIITTLTIWGGVFNVGMVKFEDKKDEMISSFQGLSISITSLFFVLSIFCMPFLTKVSGLTERLIIALFVDILSQIPYNIWATEQRYKYKYKKLVVLTLFMTIANPILGYIAVTHTIHKVEARIISGLIIQTVVGIVLFLKQQVKGKHFFSIEFWKYGFLFNIVLIPHYLSTQILNQSDRLMIDSMCGSSDAGIYSVAYSFAMLLTLITGGVNSSLTPYIYQSMKGEKVKELPKQISGVVFIMGLVTIGMIAFIPDVFMLLLPDSYMAALKVIPPVAAGAFFMFLYPLFGSVEFYFEENKFVTVASLLGAALNVILNLIFIKLFGFIAAAYTTLFCYICYAVFHYFAMQYVMKKHDYNAKLYDIRTITIISIAITIFSIFMVFLYDFPVIRWMVILCILLLIVVKRNYFVSLIRLISNRR